MTSPNDPTPISRRSFIGVAAAGAGLALAASGGRSFAGSSTAARTAARGAAYTGPDVTLQFWNGFTGGDGPFMKDLVDTFNGENPNITVEMTTLQWGDFYAKVPNAVAAGAGPEIAVMHIDQLATNAARRVVVPLDDLASALELTESDFHPVVWSAGVYQDQRYGIPLDVHPLGLYANTAQLATAGIDELPADRAAFEDAVTALQESGVEQPFWVTATWPAHLMFIALINQFGGSIYDAEGATATFNSEAGVESLNWLTSFIDSGASPKNVAADAQAQAFRQQKNAVTWDGIWMMNEWAKVDGLEWAAAAVPVIGEKPAVWASSHQFVVTSQAAGDDNKFAAASAFIAWISERSIDWAVSGQIPARNSVRESAEFEALEVQSILAAQLPDVVFPPTIPGIGDVTGPTFELAVNEVILGKAEVQEALDGAAQKADELLADNRSKYGD
jgi:multiple sugar transport system substrate-binding protein